MSKKDNFVYLTQEGLDNLKKELAYLKNEKRLEIAERLKEAISYWDLSENSEYEDARNEQAQVEQKIKELEVELKMVKLVDESKNENKVKLGSVVTVLELDDSEAKEEEFKIMGTMEADILAEPKRISNESPVGKALMGKKKWDTVKVKTLAWSAEFKIVDFK